MIRVKQVLSTTINEPTTNQRLIFKGKALAGMMYSVSAAHCIHPTDDKPLKFYNVTNGSKLNLVVKPVTTTGTAPTTASTVSTTATTAATSSSSSTSSTVKDSSKKGHFQLLLQQFLEQHYTPEDVTKLMEELNKVKDLVILIVTCTLIQCRVYMT